MGIRAEAEAETAALGTMPWPPVPPSESVIHLPQDQYLHLGAPTEWWWHTGTLKSGDRTFGFEINAASFVGKTPPFAFTQICLADVAHNRYYQNTTPYFPPVLFDGNAWAESDPTQDWYAQLGSVDHRLSAIQVVTPGSGYTSEPKVEITGGGGSGALAVAVMEQDPGQPNSKEKILAAILLLAPGRGYTSVPTVTISGGGGSGATARAFHSYVTMSAPAANPTKNMSVRALLNDQATGEEVQFDLMLSQEGPPFIVWGSGVAPVPGTSGPPLQTNNYYYSLTRLHASGSVAFGGHSFPVTGMTWMDHEYGAFGKQTTTPKWILQDMQLTNGVCISNSIGIESTDSRPTAGTPIPGAHATIQKADGTTYYVPSVITPSDPWPDPAKGPYFMQMKVEIPSFGAQLVVTSLMKAQLFTLPNSPVYEGVAGVSGTFNGQGVTGTAWNEQALG
jgi:predicted secreted hydrolase